MMISTKGRYALSTLIDIAKNEEENTPVSIKEIAERQGISIKYLEQIIALMVKGKLLKSIRGAKGGYLLSKEAGDILVGNSRCCGRHSCSCRMCTRGCVLRKIRLLPHFPVI